MSIYVIAAIATVALIALVLLLVAARIARRPETAANSWNAYVADVAARDAANAERIAAGTADWMREADHRFAVAALSLGAERREVETATFNRAFGLA